MSKVLCRCGEVLDLVPARTTIEFLLVPEQAVEEAAACLDNADLTMEELFERLDRDARDVLECPRCHRLLVQRRGEVRYASYVPEADAG